MGLDFEGCTDGLGADLLVVPVAVWACLRSGRNGGALVRDGGVAELREWTRPVKLTR